jgi:hypothetical protein
MVPSIAHDDTLLDTVITGNGINNGQPFGNEDVITNDRYAFPLWNIRCVHVGIGITFRRTLRHNDEDAIDKHNTKPNIFPTNTLAVVLSASDVDIITIRVDVLDTNISQQPLCRVAAQQDAYNYFCHSDSTAFKRISNMDGEDDIFCNRHVTQHTFAE